MKNLISFDLNIQDLPQMNSNIEWWYFNCHFHEIKSRKKYSFFFSLFKIKNKAKNDFSYFVIYALIDHQSMTHQASTIVDKSFSLEMHNHIIDANPDNNPFLNYIAKILNESEEDLPVSIENITQSLNENELNFKFGNSKFSKNNDGYSLYIDDSKININFNFNMTAKPILHGVDGVSLSQSSEMDQMFYYFLPYGDLTGSYNSEVINGIAWYDHEYSINENVEKEPINEKGWIWFSLQLDNKEQISIYQIYDKSSKDLIECIGKYIDKNGSVRTFTNFSVEELEYWQSARSFIKYPVMWKVLIPDLNAEIQIKTIFNEQEIITLITESAFYEGVVDLTYKNNRHKIKGVGFVEMHGIDQDLLQDPKKLLNAVSDFTLHEIHTNQLPKHTEQIGNHIIKDSLLSKFVNDIPYHKLNESGLDPLRDMVFRRGKCWRSILCMISINAVGGNSEDHRQWPGIIELVQSSTLILDDIQDNSKFRRGKETIHEKYGLAKAINAGLLGFFLFNSFIDQSKLSAEKLNLIYTSYFDVSTCTIMGQCADISGLQDLFFTAIETGDNINLLDSINALHALKTGAPAKFLAEVGAILGGATIKQIDYLGRYACKVGLAFQYIDDVIAYKGDKRSLEEDVMEGKITLPIAMAIPMLSEKQRFWVKDIVTYKKKEELSNMVSLFNELGIVDLCINNAKSMVSKSWDELEPHIPNSIYKAMLYYIGIFVLDVHLTDKT